LISQRLRPVALSVALALASVGGAYAQSDNNNNSNAAVDTKNTATGDKFIPSASLQKGANSFTEGEARSRLESAGLSNVTDLKKDDQGIWRGKAQQNGKSVTVGLDYKGKMSAE
jgi:periplasmic protein CpxP/Spy